MFLQLVAMVYGEWLPGCC